MTEERRRRTFAEVFTAEPPKLRPVPVPAKSTVTANNADTEISAETAKDTVTVENTVTEQPPPPSQQNTVTAESAVTVSVAHPEQYYSAPNELDDKIMPTLRPSEQVVLRRIYRLTRGFHKAICNVSVGKLATACNISEKKAGMALNLLEERNLIRRVDSSNKGKRNEERGLLIECMIPEAVAAKSTVSAKSAVTVKNSVTATNTDNKIKALKENNKRENELSLDIKACPDCQGSGFWYPEGTGKGVAKCKHLRLTEGK
jgi:hypothetical protein